MLQIILVEKIYIMAYSIKLDKQNLFKGLKT